MGQAGSKPFEGKVIQSLTGHNREVLHCQFNNTGDILATCSADETVILWTVATGEPLRTLKGHESGVTCCCFYDNILATASTDKTVILWLHASGKRASKLGKRSWVTEVLNMMIMKMEHFKYKPRYIMYFFIYNLYLKRVQFPNETCTSREIGGYSRFDYVPMNGWNIFILPRSEWLMLFKQSHSFIFSIHGN